MILNIITDKYKECKNKFFWMHIRNVLEDDVDCGMLMEQRALCARLISVYSGG